MDPLILGIYGKSKSGKTNLIVKIIKQLSNEGFKISSVKISDKKINIDTKGKDTWKHAKAGAKLVILSSKDKIDFLLNIREDISEIIPQINCIDDFDLIIIEGANDDFTQKIRLGDIKERKNTILSYKGDFEGLIQTLKKEIIMMKTMNKMNIKVNGKQIILTEFPEDFIKNTICGMLKSLKGVDEIKNVEIKFEL
jgi:molybdopterin-guanine dinucleotide biosynthesis protein MobB